MEKENDFQKIMEEFGTMMDSWWPYTVAIILGIITFIRTYMSGTSCPSDERIDGKIVVITGASSGIGREVALELGRRGGHIILAVRNEDEGQKVAEEIRKKTNAKVEVKSIDLSSLKSVQHFADNLDVNEVDILINNAGIVFHPFEKTDEGFELHFVTNYLGHFLLTQLLLPKLKAANQGRIINVTAPAYSASKIHLEDLNLSNDYTAREAFGQSKLALILMSKHMSSLLKNSNVTINATNPGIPGMWLLLKNPHQGAQSVIFAAVSSSLNNQSGQLISDCEVKTVDEKLIVDTVATELYEKSLLLVQPYLQEQMNQPEPEQISV